MKLFLSVLLTISIVYGVIRTPQSDWSSIEMLSPLNDKNYFNVMGTRTQDLKMASKVVSKTAIAAKAKKPLQTKNPLKIVGLENTLRAYAYGNKFYIPRRIDLKDPWADSLNRSIPSYIPPSQREAEVVKFFGDRMVQNWLSSSAVKNSSFGKAASSMEQAMKVETSIAAPSVNTGSKAIDHRFSFQYLAFQSQAKVDYKGWTQAQFKHDSRAREVSVEVSEKVFKNKDLVLNHTKNSIEGRSTLALRWNW